MSAGAWAAGRAGERPRGWLSRPSASLHLLLGSCALLVVLGLVMVLSASSVQSYAAYHSSFRIFVKQAMWVGMGLPAMWVATRLPVRVYRMLGYPLLLASIVLLLAVLVPGVGHNVYGSTRWIPLPGGFQLQPSELAKLALVLWGSDLICRKERLMGRLRHLLVPLVPVTVLLALLVLVEPDMGTATVLLLVMLALLWVSGAPLRVFAVTGGTLGASLGLLAVAAPYRLARLTNFTDPFRHAQGAGYQAVQGLYALSSGGWFGLGLGASREKWAYLPNQYTDYIYAIIGEELGLVGTLLVLVLFVILGYAGIRIARSTEDPFCRLAATATIAWLIGQAVINIGAVVGVLPITGIPLPMVSFGGSALIVTLFAVGMLASFARADAARPAAGRRGAGER